MVRILGTTIIDKDQYWWAQVGDRQYDIPKPEKGAPLKRKDTGASGPLIKTYANVSLDRVNKNINELTDKENSLIALGVSKEYYDGLPNEDKIKIQNDVEMGDRISWSIKIADKEVYREEKAGKIQLDKKDAATRYDLVVALYNAKDQAPARDILADDKDWVAMTEVKNGKTTWKDVPESAYSQALLGKASLVLDEVGRGFTKKELNDPVKNIFGDYASIDALLSEAIDYCVKARDLLKTLKTSSRDYYNICRSIVTEAKLRSLRRKQAAGADGKKYIVQEDSNNAIKALLAQVKQYNIFDDKKMITETWKQKSSKDKYPAKNNGDKWKDTIKLNNISISVDAEKIDENTVRYTATQTLDQWINCNEKTIRYADVDINAETEAVPLVKIGIVYMQASAELEAAKLDIESDDPEVVKAAARKCDDVLNILIGDAYDGSNSIKTVNKSIMQLAKEYKLGENTGMVYARKTGDYVRFDALVSKADLTAVYGSIKGYDAKKKIDYESDSYKISKAIYESISDFRKQCPYQDIHDRAIDGVNSMKQMMELFEYSKVTGLLDKYYDPTPEAGDDDIKSAFYSGSYLFYKLLLNHSKLLIMRNDWVEQYPTRNMAGDPAKKIPGINGSAPTFGFNANGNPQPESLVKDCTMAYYFALDIIQNCNPKNPVVKATNLKGVADLYYRARLVIIQAQVRKLKYTPEEGRLEMIAAIKTDLNDLITELDASKAKLIANANSDKVEAWKYNNMDYPYYIDMYNELASVLEQEAMLETKQQREIDPTVESVKEAFKPAENAYAVLDELTTCKQSRSVYNKYLRPIAIKLRLENIKSLETIKDTSRDLGSKDDIKKLEAEVAAIEKMTLGDKTLKDLADLINTKDNQVSLTFGSEKVLVLRETLEGLYATVNSMKVDFYSRAAFCVNKLVDDYNKEDKKAKLKDLFVKTRTAADLCADKLSDPYYVLSNMIGVAMINLKYQKSVSMEAIIRYVDKFNSLDVRFSPELTESLSVVAAVYKDMRLAKKVVDSLESLITVTESSTPTTEKQKQDKYATLADSYYWMGNLLAWFYDERTEKGDIADLEKASDCYTKAIANTKKYMPATEGAPYYSAISAQMNKISVDYRIANAKCKKSLENGEEKAVTKLITGYKGLAASLKQIMDMDPDKFKYKKVRFMTDEDLKMRLVEYRASQVQAPLLARSMSFAMRNLLENKSKIVNANDGLITYKPDMTDFEVYFETAFAVGKLYNDDQIAQGNRNRASKKDRWGTKIFDQAQYKNKLNMAAESVTYASTTLEAVRPVFTALGQNIAAKDDIIAAANTLLEKGRDLAGKILKVKIAKDTTITEEELKDMKMDKSGLDYAELSELGNIATLIPLDDPLKTALSNSYKKISDNSDETKTIKAITTSWKAMAEENPINMKTADDWFNSVSSDNQDAELLRNWGELRSVRFYKDRSLGVDMPLDVYTKLINKDHSTSGAIAYNNMANLKIGVQIFDEARNCALKSLEFLTGRKPPKDVDAALFYIGVINNDELLGLQLKSDKVVLEALAWLVVAETWQYTSAKKSDPKSVWGGLVTITCGDARKIYGLNLPETLKDDKTIERDAKYLMLRKKLYAVVKLGRDAKGKNKYENDVALNKVYNPRSGVGVIWATGQLKNAYGVSKTEDSELKKMGKDENKYCIPSE